MKKLMALLLALLTCFAAALADTASAPDIPQGTLNAEVMSFTPGQTYAVYSAPDSRSIRGAKGRARVSTNGWIQVFGAGRRLAAGAVCHHPGALPHRVY